MGAGALRGVILVLARLGTGHLLADAEYRPVGARVASYIIYTPMTVSAVQTL